MKWLTKKNECKIDSMAWNARAWVATMAWFACLTGQSGDFAKAKGVQRCGGMKSRRTMVT